MIKPRYFNHLKGTLTGISDRSLSAHLELYERYVRQHNAIEAAYPMTTWGVGSLGADERVAKLLKTRVADLGLAITSPLSEILAEVTAELASRGVMFWPGTYLGDGDFWTANLGTSVNVPWYLANPTLWRLANRQAETAYTHEQVARVLRHEFGHAVGYAYGLNRRPDWTQLFGDFNQPYREVFPTDPRSEEHVEYLTGVPAHYGQKHPDEDWAETFAAWLDPNSRWEEAYASWPRALEKLRYVDALAKSGVFSVAPTNVWPGRTVPYQQVRGRVMDHLGAAEGAQPFRGIEGWSEHVELLRREPHAYDAVVLHEAYFDVLGRKGLPESWEGAAPAGPLAQKIASDWGSVESYLLDLRTIAGAVSNGWAVTVWDARAGKLRNAMVEGHSSGVLVGCPVILAIDAWEHAYFADYGTRKDVYLAAVFENIDWRVVAGKLYTQFPVVGLPATSITVGNTTLSASVSVSDLVVAQSSAFPENT